MSDEGDTGSGGILVPRATRFLTIMGMLCGHFFVVSAILLIVAKSTGANLPLSTFGTVLVAVVLVVAAGITNPAQFWIHWANAFLAACGTILFGVTAIRHYRTGASIFDVSFIYVEVIALLSLVALYFTTRTVRGLHMRPDYFE